MTAGKVAKNTAYLLAAFVGQKVLAFVYFTIIARAVGVEGSGRYFLATSFTTIFSIFIDLGLSNMLIREVAKFPDRARKLLGNVLGAKVVLSAATVGVTLVVARLLGYPPEVQTMIAIACAVMVLDSTHLVLYGTMRGLQNLRYEAFGVIGGQIVTIVAGSLFLALRLPLPSLIVALLLGSAWNVVWSYAIVARKFGITATPEWDPAMLRFFLAVATPFALSGIFARVYSAIDSIMLSKLAPESAVGFYAVAYKIVFAFQFLPIAFSAAVYPAMAAYHVSNRERLKTTYTTAFTYLTIVVVPITVGIFLLSRQIILTLYGDDFAGSIGPLQVLIFSLVFAFLYWPSGSLLNACDRQQDNTVAMGVTTAVNIACNAVLIPRMGALGAAISAFVGNIVLFGVATAYGYRVAKADTRAVLRTLLKVSGAAAAMAAVVLSLRGRAPLAAVVALGGLVYSAALILFKGVTIAELRLLANIFFKRRKAVSDISPTE